MKISDILPTADQLKAARGIEADLLRRRYRSAVSGFVAVFFAAVQLVALVLGHEGLGSFLEKVFSGTGGAWIGPVVVFVCASAYFLLRWTGVLMHESKEPFKYTFW